MTNAIYEAGFNSSGRFYEKSNNVLGMTPWQFRAGGVDTDIFFAIAECSLGSILVAQSKKGVRSILIGVDPDSACTGPPRSTPKGKSDRGRARLRRSGSQGCWID